MKAFIIDISKCNGCYNCQIACKDEHVGNDWTPIAKPQPDTGHFWMKVTDIVQGTVPKVRVRYMHDMCQHCEEAPCIPACKSQAIYKRDDDIVIIDPEKCTGCEAKSESIAVEKRKTSPCKGNCPANINVQGYVNLAAQGKFQEALKLIKDENPFPAICGRVCHHPCESACIRGDVDEPVAINAIKRFISDLDLDPETRYVPEIEEKKNERYGKFTKNAKKRKRDAREAAERID